MNIQKKLVGAYIWNLMGKWGGRCIGIVSTVILARLIAPESFGLVALSAICIGFFEALHTIGIERYLLTQTNLDAKSMNSAWTLNIILKFIMCMILIIFSPVFADLFNEPKLDLIIKIVSISGFFGSFNNIGLVKLHKNLSFEKITYLSLIVKILSTIVTIIFAYFSPNHWALIAGAATGLWIYLIGTYLICDYKPKLNFNFEKEMFTFSIFIIIRNVLSYCRSKVDILIVNKIFDISSVGRYKIGLDFAVLPFVEVIAPAGRTMFPGMANFKNDKEELFDKTYKYLALVYLFVIPSVVGVWFISPQFVAIVLGEKWIGTEQIMSSLAILMISYPISAIVNNLFDYLNMTKYGIFIDLFGLLLICLFALSFTFDNISDFSVIRGYIGILVFLFVVIFAHFTIQISIKKVCEVISLPVLSSVFMYWALTSIFFNESNTIYALLSNILFGSLSYGVCFFLLLNVSKFFSDIWKFWYIKVINVSIVVCKHYFKFIKEKSFF